MAEDRLHTASEMEETESASAQGREKEAIPDENISTKSKDEENGPQHAAVSSPPVATPSPPPNGGLVAWLQVLGGFFIYFNTWGLITTFGIFQTYYQSNYLSEYSPSSISWIGTTQAFLLIEVGIICGPLYDLGYLRSVLAVGVVLTSLGVMMTSLATSYYQVFLSLGVCTGVGMGCTFFPGISTIAAYFSTKRSTANGIAAVGSAIGSILYSIMLRQLILTTTFPWAVRAVGFLALATLLVPLATMRPRALPRTSRRLFDVSAFRQPSFALFSAMNPVPWLGLLVPFYYMPAFAASQLGADDNRAFYVLAVMGAGSVPGRLIPSMLADRFGAIWVYGAALLACAVVAFAWEGVVSFGGLLAVGVVYGFVSGAAVALPAMVVAQICPDMRLIGTRIGTCSALTGLGFLCGNPIAGAIREGASGYRGLEGFTGAVLVVGSIFTFLCGWLLRKETRQAP